eukprot:scaffold1527_cov145-Skeletonema_menzelii.AAC.14
MGTYSLGEERDSFQCKIGRWRPLNIRVFTVDARAQFRARGVEKNKDEDLWYRKQGERCIAQPKKLKWIGGWRGERGEEGGGEKKSFDDGQASGNKREQREKKAGQLEAKGLAGGRARP